MSHTADYPETAFGLQPFEPSDHQGAAEELEQERLERETPIDHDDADTRLEILKYFPCPDCDGHGARVKRSGNAKMAELCARCDGEGELGATESHLEAASQIGSNNPFCRHDWSFTGTAYGGDDESYHGEGRCLCSLCGADGDA